MYFSRGSFQLKLSCDSLTCTAVLESLLQENHVARWFMCLPLQDNKTSVMKKSYRDRIISLPKDNSHLSMLSLQLQCWAWEIFLSCPNHRVNLVLHLSGVFFAVLVAE